MPYDNRTFIRIKIVVNLSKREQLLSCIASLSNSCQGVRPTRGSMHGILLGPASKYGTDLGVTRRVRSKWSVMVRIRLLRPGFKPEG
jgi:hypothetical protein